MAICNQFEGKLQQNVNYPNMTKIEANSIFHKKIAGIVVGFFKGACFLVMRNA
jgi:hypothetical protein